MEGSGHPNFLPYLKGQQLVLLKAFKKGDLTINKFTPKFTGPFQVKEVHRNGLNYQIVKCDDGNSVERKAHYSQLKPWYEIPRYITRYYPEVFLQHGEVKETDDRAPPEMVLRENQYIYWGNVDTEENETVEHISSNYTETVPDDRPQQLASIFEVEDETEFSQETKSDKYCTSPLRSLVDRQTELVDETIQSFQEQLNELTENFEEIEQVADENETVGSNNRNFLNPEQQRKLIVRRKEHRKMGLQRLNLQLSSATNRLRRKLVNSLRLLSLTSSSSESELGEEERSARIYPPPNIVQTRSRGVVPDYANAQPLILERKKKELL